MNEANKMATYIIIAIVLISIFGLVADHYREYIDPGELDRQRLELDREYKERERRITANLGELGSVTENAIASAERAGNIAERSAAGLQSAGTDLREAKRVLEELASQVQDLQSELDNCRTDLYRIRSLAGIPTSPIAE
jgi:chromosome segregation ATPase